MNEQKENNKWIKELLDLTLDLDLLQILMGSSFARAALFHQVSRKSGL